jgi:hypothetical protein
MSQLSPFVRFSRTLSSYLSQQAEIARIDGVEAHWHLLSALSHAFGATASNLEQQIAKDLNRPHGWGEQALSPDPIKVVPGLDKPPPLSLGSINPNTGALLSTAGWVHCGVVWITEDQAKAAEPHGWRKTGTEKPFLDMMLFEVER